ncbi:DUF3040 domain-containing protein [Pseudonocardiaceae bacterium YIM PH 21723]|nr:DUF3040 domain-containing protein [Pseudonocardiaceae bacterium YIM PH 21723]
MLSQYERRQLQDIEQHLTEEAPKLAAALASGRITHLRWWWALLCGLGLLMFLTGLVTASALLAFGGLGTCLVALLALWTTHTPGARTRKDTHE